MGQGRVLQVTKSRADDDSMYAVVMDSDELTIFPNNYVEGPKTNNSDGDHPLRHAFTMRRPFKHRPDKFCGPFLSQERLETGKISEETCHFQTPGFECNVEN